MKDNAVVWLTELKPIQILPQGIQVKIDDKKKYASYYKIKAPISGYINKQNVRNRVLTKQTTVKNYPPKKLKKGTEVIITGDKDKDFYLISSPFDGSIAKKDLNTSELSVRQLASLFEKKSRKFPTATEKAKVFDPYMKRDAYVFMVGNNNYPMDKLKYCISDMRLLEEIFVTSMKIDRDNISSNSDISLLEFKRRFNAFKKRVPANSLLIITYSGHGTEEGALSFKDGDLPSASLKKMIKTDFDNDVLLIIDACYSGTIDTGPKDFGKKNQEAGFKDNSIRIYASLAHATAREIDYIHPKDASEKKFFKPVKDFSVNFLGLKGKLALKGNGYFTALFAYYFAEQKNYQNNGNIYFHDVVSYINEKSKEYVEFLAKQSHTRSSKIANRVLQLPRIEPKSKGKLHGYHNFILLQDVMNMETGLDVSIIFIQGAFSNLYSSPAWMINAYYAYELDFLLKELFITGNLHYLRLNSTSASDRRSVKANVIMMGSGVKYYPLRYGKFDLSTGLDGGIALTFAQIGSFGPIAEETKSYTNLYGIANITPQYTVVDNINSELAITVPIKFLLIGYKDNMFYGLSAGVGVNYYF